MIIKYHEYSWDHAIIELYECELDFDPEEIREWLRKEFNHHWLTPWETGHDKGFFYGYLSFHLHPRILMQMKLTFC